MAFITEKIAEQDIQSYGLRTLSEKLKAGQPFEWTIDRERDIYLRWMDYNWQKPTDQEFSFYWKGYVLRINLSSLSVVNEPGGPLNQTWGVISFDGSGKFFLPPELERQRDQLTSDLKEALIARGRANCIRSNSEYIAQFQF